MEIQHSERRHYVRTTWKAGRILAHGLVEFMYNPNIAGKVQPLPYAAPWKSKLLPWESRACTCSHTGMGNFMRV